MSSLKSILMRPLRPWVRASRIPQGGIELQLLGKTLLHSAVVGATVGAACCVFYALLEWMEVMVLERLTGYVPLRAAGEELLANPVRPVFRWWLLWLFPAFGAACAGWISTRFAPETLGGGSDVVIDAFHNKEGVLRRRVPFIKTIVSVLTLGFGGSGGREGPTMLIGGSIGSSVARYLRVSERERRILLVAGTAAGMAAVFRTPLGAALLAVEVLHRDDFESDALVPAVLSSVVAYSVFISFFGESTLFAHAVRYPFVPVHLPLYALMAVFVSLFANFFVGTLHSVQKLTARMSARLPPWTKPALGGLALGLVTTPLVWALGPYVGPRGQGLGLLGGGYGAAQVAITGASWFPAGWHGVELLLLLGVVKIVATSLTVGTGGSAGDFGPSLVIGGIFGGMFGRTAQLLLHDPRIDPGAFALVGMATFYGGLAHVPIASLVMTCELAGSYDLLVPLMLAEGIAFVALRRRTLYHAQVATRRDSPAHRDDLILDVLKGVKVGEVVVRNRPYVTFARKTPAREVLDKVSSSAWQDAFPVLEPDGKLAGIVSSDVARTLAAEPEVVALAVADDLMQPPVSVKDTEDLHLALELLLAQGARELVVTDAEDRIVGFLDEAEIAKTYHRQVSDETDDAKVERSGRWKL